MIDKYLISTCLFTIDEFNERYHNLTATELKEKADKEFCEADLVVRLGYPFRQMANFNMQGNANDIVVKSKDFVIEVKYLRNFKNPNGGNYTNKLKWDEAFQHDFDWLCDEIKGNKKGQRAFILGWFNTGDNFSNVMQLGTGPGPNPNINRERIALFPFLDYNPESTKITSIYYLYEKAYIEKQIRIPGIKDDVNCMFIGSIADKFHFAMYW